MSRYGDNCEAHDLPRDECVYCVSEALDKSVAEIDWLSAEVERLNELARYYRKLEAKLAIATEVLEKYADTKQYFLDDYGDWCLCIDGPLEDGPELARTALEKINKNTEAELAEANIYKKYVQIGGVGPIYCLHGSSSIDAFEALEQQFNEARAESRRLKRWLELHQAGSILERAEKAEAELTSYKAGVEVEGVIEYYPGTRIAGVFVHQKMPDEQVGQQVRVLVRAKEGVCK